jgi:hypothetical protein
MEHERQSFQFYRGLNALRDLLAEIQGTANLDADLAAQEGIGAVYGKYNGQTYPVDVLTSASITVTCYANEATVPALHGGAQDLNFDGDSGDNHGGAANGSDLLIVPVTLALTYNDGKGTQTLTLHRLVTQTTD